VIRALGLTACLLAIGCVAGCRTQLLPDDLGLFTDLGPSSDLGGADLAGPDLSTPDLATVPDLATAPDGGRPASCGPLPNCGTCASGICCGGSCCQPGEFCGSDGACHCGDPTAKGCLPSQICGVGGPSDPDQCGNFCCGDATNPCPL
jgi:hypothetical protein